MTKKKDGLRINETLCVLHTDRSGSMLISHKVIVCALGQNYKQIAELLTKRFGLTENKDFIQHELFLTEYFSRFHNKCYMLKTDVFVTSLCNLNCENCASFVPYSKNKKSLDVKTIKNSVDRFFDVCDFVFSMDIFGGEPLLYKDLVELLEYIKTNYGKKIGYLGIITNGLMAPSDELLTSLKKLDISLSVSDYSSTLGCDIQIDTFCDKLDAFEIHYIRNRFMNWKNLGFPNPKTTWTGKKALAHRKMCNTTCHVLYDGKFFFCATCVAAVAGELFHPMTDDYLDLRTNVSKKEMLDFANGNYDKECVGFCTVCAGFGVDNADWIPAALQIKK